MALIRWQPFQEMETLRSQLDDLFDELVSFNGESRGEARTAWMPAVELEDTDENFILRAEIPGVEAKDLDIQVSREAVWLAGEHRHEHNTQEQGIFRSEFRYGKFQRQIPLPVPVHHDQVQAEFKNGILTLTLPKVEEARRRVVKIDLGHSQNAIPSAESATTVDVSSEQVPDSHNRS